MVKHKKTFSGDEVSNPYSDKAALKEMLFSLNTPMFPKKVTEATPLPRDFFGPVTPPVRNIVGSYSKGLPGPTIDMSESVDLLKGILHAEEVRNSVMSLKRGLIGTAQNIATTPVRIIQARFLRGYIISNPTIATGKANTGTLLVSATRATGSGLTTATPVDVSDYREIKLYLDITANAGLDTIQIDALSQDPLTLKWATSQADLFVSPSAVGTYYENLGSLGVDQNFAIRWTVTNVGGGDPTFSLSYTLKDASSAFSLSNTIYIGNAGVTPTSGYPLLEGRELPIFLEPNVELWAVSNVSAGLGLRIFELQ